MQTILITIGKAVATAAILAAANAAVEAIKNQD